MRHCWGTMTMPHTRYGHDQDRSRNMRTRNRRLGPLVQHPPPLPLGGITPQQAENQHTTTRKEAASTSLHKTRDLTHPLRGIAPVTSRCTRYVAIHPLRGAAPVTSRCTRYVALHPLRGAAPVTSRCTRTEGVQCLQIGCNAYTSGARPPVTSSDADLPEWRSTDPTGLAVPGSEPPNNQQGPAASPNNQQDPAAAQPPQPTAPDGGAVQTAGWARGRQGLTGLRDDEPSGRLAAQTTSGPPSARLAALARHKAWARRSRGIKPGRVAPAASSPGASLPRHQARARGAGHTCNKPGPGARGTHATSPGTTRAYDEAGTRRAKQRRGPRPRRQVRPGDPP